MTETLEQPTKTANVINEVPTSPAEMEKYEKYIDRTFIRANEKGEELNVCNPTGEKLEKSKDKFIYRVDGMFMRYFGYGNVSQGVMRFQVQKLYKNKFVEVTSKFKNSNVAKKVNQQVMSHETIIDRISGLNTVSLVDADASFAIDAKDFEKNFKPE